MIAAIPQTDRAAIREALQAHHLALAIGYRDGQAQTLKSPAVLDLMLTLERAAEALR
jgi:hypothetical protein